MPMRQKPLPYPKDGKVSLPDAGRPVTDVQLVRATRDAMRGFAASVPSEPAAAFSILETAGGVCSPAPSGTLQVPSRTPETARQKIR